MNTDPVQHAHNVLGVSEGADLLTALAVDDSERLQTQTLHGYFGSQQETMVELVKKLIPRKRDDSNHSERLVMADAK